MKFGLGGKQLWTRPRSSSNQMDKPIVEPCVGKMIGQAVISETFLSLRAMGVSEILPIFDIGVTCIQNRLHEP